MRLRNVAGSREYIRDSEFCIQDPESFRGKWKPLFFKNNNPLYIEIGMGKGDFLHTIAAAHHDINYLGLEKYSSVLYRAIEKRQETSLNNLFFIRFDAVYLTNIFDEGEVDRIYLNFSDPWPKDRHAKRRLTSPSFLSMYDKILSPDGDIRFKTDNRALFDYSVDVVRESDTWEIRELTYDLHHEPMVYTDVDPESSTAPKAVLPQDLPEEAQAIDPPGNVMTEYEKKFTSLGHPICRLVMSRKA